MSKQLTMEELRKRLEENQKKHDEKQKKLHDQLKAKEKEDDELTGKKVKERFHLDSCDAVMKKLDELGIQKQS